MNGILRRLLWGGVGSAVLVWSACPQATWAGPRIMPGRATNVRRDAEPMPAAAAMTAGAAAAPGSGGPGLTIGSNTNYAQQVPAISIEASSPMISNVGKPFEQQILVKNVGSVPADQVEVRGTFSLQATFLATEPKADINGSTLIWRFPRLEVGAQEKLTIQLKPLIPGELSCNTVVSFSSSTAVKVQVGQPKLKLACEGPTDTQVGSELHLVLTVTNTGTGPASNVRIRQLLPGVYQTSSARAAGSPLQIEVGVLEPGESRVVQTAAPTREPGQVRIALVAESDDGTQATVDHVVKIRTPKLSLNSSGPDFRYLNRKATYQFELANSGDAIAEKVNVMVGLPEGFQYVEAGTGGIYDKDKRTVTWQFAGLDAGQRVELPLTVLAKTEGEHLQRAAAWAENCAPVKAEKLTRVEGSASIIMEVIDTEDPVEIGSETTYQIHVANRGSKAAEHVTIVANAPEGMQVMGAEAPIAYHTQGQQVIFDEIPVLAPQSVITLKVQAKGLRRGNVRFQAELSSESLNSPITAEQMTEIYGD